MRPRTMASIPDISITTMRKISRYIVGGLCCGVAGRLRCGCEPQVYSVRRQVRHPSCDGLGKTAGNRRLPGGKCGGLDRERLAVFHKWNNWLRWREEGLLP